LGRYGVMGIINSRTRPRVNRVLRNQLACDVLNLVTYHSRGKHYFCHLISPPTVQSPCLDTWMYLSDAVKVGWVGIGLASVYCMTHLLLRVQNPLSLTLQWLCRLLMFRTVRRYFRKGVGGRSDSVECLLVPYVFSSRCVCYVHDAIYIFNCRVCRYDSRGLIQKFPAWWRNLHSSCVSAKKR